MTKANTLLTLVTLLLLPSAPLATKSGRGKGSALHKAVDHGHDHLKNESSQEEPVVEPATSTIRPGLQHAASIILNHLGIPEVPHVPVSDVITVAEPGGQDDEDGDKDYQACNGTLSLFRVTRTMSANLLSLENHAATAVAPIRVPIITLGSPINAAMIEGDCCWDVYSDVFFTGVATSLSTVNRLVAIEFIEPIKSARVGHCQ